MKTRNIKSRALPLGIGLALSASLFATPILTVHADGFDGNAYLIWDCGEDTPCYHLFTDINTDNTYTIYNDGFAADNHTTKTFSAENVNTNTTTFALKAAYDTYKASNPSHTMQNVMEAEVSGERLALNPLEAPIETKAYTHFGDRNFKVMIKAPGYVGVSLRNATDGYEPDFGSALNSVTYRNIAGTTETNPTILYAIPQQTEIILSMEGVVDSVEALNVENPDAVIVRHIDNLWKISFKSAYYDRVLFKVTSGATTGYIQVFRTAVQVQKTDYNTPPMPNGKTITAVVYFDAAKECGDFEVSAKLVYKAGGTKTIKLSPATQHDNGYGDIEPGCLAERGGGLNLQKGYYTAQADVNLIDLNGIYFTVANAGSTATTYAGTVSGSKKGIYLNLEGTPMTNSKYATITSEKN